MAALQIGFDLAECSSEVIGIKWRLEQREIDMIHRGVLTSRRNIDDARRLMDEKAEQLRAVGQLATMMAFFASSALCEIQIPGNTNSAVILLFGMLSAVVITLSMIATLGTIYLLVGLYKFDCSNRRDPVAELQTFWNQHFEMDWKIVFYSFISSLAFFILLFSQGAWVVFWQHGHHILASGISTAVAVLTLLFIYFQIYIKWWHVLKEGSNMI